MLYAHVINHMIWNVQLDRMEKHESQRKGGIEKMRKRERVETWKEKGRSGGNDGDKKERR